MENDDVIRVYVGVDRSQLLAVPVLEYSIKRHTTARVEVIPMLDLPVPEPKDPRNGQRTGFSFSRFCIPKLAGYRGKAIYMDADMLVFRDIRKLWDLPFNGAKILIQEEVKFADVTMAKENAPKERKKQCAVMLLDCARLDWDVNEIVQGMDEERYTYDQLMSKLCILPENEVGYGVPFEWNSLEHYDAGTCLIHYTDMGTQPWASTRNSNGYLWFDEVRRMLRAGVLSIEQIRDEIAHGYFRPSLFREIRYGHLVPQPFRSFFNDRNEAYDKRCGYIPHKSVYDQKRIRNKAIKEYERSISRVKN